PAGTLLKLRAGSAAMAIGWPAPEQAGGSVNNESVRLGFALLPGSRQAYRYGTRRWDERTADENRHVPLLSIAGRMAAVASSSADRRRAQGFVIWLAGSEVSQQVSPHSPATTLFRQSQMASAARWTASLRPA